MVSKDATTPWSRMKRDVGVIVWSSFLAASLASLIFFAYLDPQLLAHDDDPPFWLADRMSGYAGGFFFFWLIAAVSGTLVAYLLDTLSEQARNDSEREQAEKKR
jgi:hypothetical protein